MQAVAGIGLKLVVHLESRDVDQENKRIETGCKGRFACVKPFCFTSFLSNYLISGKTDSFFLNLSASLEEEWLQCWRRNSWVLRGSKISSYCYHLFWPWESMWKSGESAAEDSVLVLAVWSSGGHSSFLTLKVFSPKLVQQPLTEATVRIFSEPTICQTPWILRWRRPGPTLKRCKVLQWKRRYSCATRCVLCMSIGLTEEGKINSAWSRQEDLYYEPFIRIFCFDQTSEEQAFQVSE